MVRPHGTQTVRGGSSGFSEVVVGGQHHDIQLRRAGRVSRSQVPRGPTQGSKYAAMRKRLELGARSRLLALERGERGVLEAPGKTRKSGQA